MLYRLGPWSARYRWPVLAAWLTAVTLSLLGLPQLISSMGVPSVAIDGAPSERAKEIVARDLPQFGDEQLLLVLGPSAALPTIRPTATPSRRPPVC